MAARSKRYRQALEGLDSEKLYSLEEAMSLIKGFPTGKFDESVDIVLDADSKDEAKARLENLDASVEVDDIRITSVHHVGRGVKPA